MFTKGSEALRGARVARGLTQEDVAELTGKSQVAVSQWERGKRTPQRQASLRLRDALGIDLEAWDLPAESSGA